MQNRPIALVVGDVSMVRALGRARIPVMLASSDANPSAASSRYCRGVVRTREGERDMIDDIVAWSRAQPERPVIFYQGDGDLLAMSRHRAHLQEHAHLVLPRAELVEDLVDKVRFARLAVERGLPVPRTATIERASAIHDVVNRWTHFPAVLKPSVRLQWIGSALQAHHESIGKAIRVESHADLVRVAELVRTHDTDCVLQAAVEGGEERILSYHAYVRPDGDIAAEFSGKKVRTRPRRYGYSTCVTLTHDDEVLAVGRDIVRRLQFTGVLKIDFKRDAHDGRLYVLEINPRFNLWHHLGTIAGVSIPRLVYEDCVRASATPGARRVPLRDVTWMSTRGDLRAFLEYRRAGELTLLRWLHEAVRADVHEDLDWRDPLPFFSDVAARAKKLIAERMPRAAPKPKASPA